MEANPIIVYGAPRSGTTYLIRTLNQHPEVFISMETRVFVWVHQSLNVLTRQDGVLLNERAAFVEHLRRLYPKLIRDFYLQLAPAARYWGDKYPAYASPQHKECLETIADLFPGARFIHIIRNGLDVVTSIARKGWVKFEAAHGVWTSYVDGGCEFGRKLPAGRYFELRYEDLIRDDLAMARKVFDFLGIEMHPDVVRFCREEQAERTPLSGPTRDMTQGAAMSDWARAWTPEQRRLSLTLLGRHLVRYRYETESSLEILSHEIEHDQGNPQRRAGSSTARSSSREQRIRPSHWLDNLKEYYGVEIPSPNIYLSDVTEGLADYEYGDGISVNLPSGREVNCRYRAPRMDFSQPYVCCLGSAHTFGRWSMKPYPRLLDDELDIQVANLGYGGVGPEFYLGISEYMEIINRSKLAIIQVMSARSSSCSLWKVMWGRRGRRVSDGRYMFLEEMVAGIRGNSALEERYLRETCATYVSEMIQLLEGISVPTILFWFSDHSAPEKIWSFRPELLGSYPQLVDMEMIQAIREHAEAYTECILPNTGNDAVGLKAEYGGRYYPSQEMQVAAAKALIREIHDSRLL